MNKYFEAVDFAHKAHKGQYRKASKIPYIIHPLSVMELLIRNGAEEEAVIAGILHDVVEDTDCTLDEIKEIFGARVAELVGYASEPHREDKWMTRKLHTIELLKGLKDKEALNVICADKYHNVMSMAKDYEYIGEELWEKFKYGKEQQKWYYTSIADVLLSNDEKNKLFNDYAIAVKSFFGE